MQRLQQRPVQQSGFTLIELVAVMIILGILAASAIPKFINLQSEARQAAVDGVAGSLESASALNHAIDLANEAGLSSDTVVAITNCTGAGNLLAGGMPSGYSLSSVAVSNGATATCTLSDTTDTSVTATFVIVGT